MLQPFEKFKAGYVEKLMQLNKPYLVSQTYKRVNTVVGDSKVSLLLSDYDDLGLAKIHYKAVLHDRYAAIVHLGKPAHVKKINDMLQPGSAYDLYWAVVKSRLQLEQQVNKRYKDRMREYLTANTTWRIDRDANIRPSVQLIFGELFIVIKHAKQVIRVKFDELEK
jgi:hypothetical protein